MKLLCRRIARRACTGVATAGSDGSAGAEHAFRIDRLERETLRLELTGKARDRLRRSRAARLQLTIVQPGVKGDHTTVRSLEVRGG